MRILAATGASGGHIFPALAFLESVRQEDPSIETLLVLPRGAVMNAADLVGQAVRTIPVGGVSPGMGKRTLISLARLVLACPRSLALLLEFKPDLVVGFGSLASVPLLLTAWFSRIPTIIHEQNVIPGAANLFLARFVDRVAVSFEESKRKFPSPRRTVYTGNPLRTRIRKIAQSDARRSLGLMPDRFTVLVTGGSQGSATINNRFIDAIRFFRDTEQLQVIHITGQAGYAELSAVYAENRVPARVFPFLKEMESAYSAADAVVCRAGATTCAELVFYALPALLVPYPFARGHQTANAAVLEKKGCCRVVRDQQLDAEKINEFIRVCLNQPGALATMRDSYQSDKRCSAARQLVKTCLEVQR